MLQSLAIVRVLGTAAATVILSSLPATLAESSSSELPYQLLIPGHYSVGELPKDAEGTWFALTWSAHGSSFVPVQVRLQAAKNPNATGDPTLPGAIVRTSHPDSAIFLVRGEGLDARRSVSTWRLGQIRMSDGDSLLVGPAGRWSLTASAATVSFDEGGEFRYVNITVSDSKSGVRQQLGGAAIHWMGDLNGDDGLDLLLLYEVETGEREWQLFLSDGQANKPFRNVASFHLPGC